MTGNARWTNSLDVLPKPKAIIIYCGILDRFEYYSGSKSWTVCAIITMEDITFLQQPPTPATDLKSKNMRDKVKARREKRKHSPSTSFADTEQTSQPTSFPSCSQKRKVGNSEDEVDDAVA